MIQNEFKCQYCDKPVSLVNLNYLKEYYAFACESGHIISAVPTVTNGDIVNKIEELKAQLKEILPQR